jgi:hypothetical protein
LKAHQEMMDVGQEEMIAKMNAHWEEMKA